MALPYYRKPGCLKMNLMLLSSLVQGRTEVLNEIPAMVSFLAELPEYEAALFVHKKSRTTLENSLENLAKAIEFWNRWRIGPETACIKRSLI